MSKNILGPDAFEWLGTYYKVILAPSESGASMSIVDTVSRPHSGPPRHIHDREDETFIILSGEIEMLLDDERITAGPGEAIFVPRGVEHAFRVIGNKPCRHLIILTPSGFEGFFEEMAQKGYRIPEDMTQIAACGRRHNLRFTGPPLEIA